MVAQPVVMVPRVEEELAKELRPVHVLVLASNVEEAAVMVMSAVPLKEVPLMFLAVSSAVAVPALPVMLAFIEVVERADHTPALTAARPLHAEEFCPVPP